MDFFKTKNYEKMSEVASDILLKCLIQKPDSLICAATGYSPTETYRLFIKKVRAQHIDVSHLRILKLDEWKGLPSDSPATCEYYIQEHLLKPLKISQERYISFNQTAADSQEECQRISRLLEENQGIDCCVLGLGRNGHLGLNEPSAELIPFLHTTSLSEKTKEHSMLAANAQSASEGYTLGLKEILDSRKILLLITGSDKEKAYQHLQKKSISSWMPANYLWLHKDTQCIVDTSSFPKSDLF